MGRHGRGRPDPFHGRLPLGGAGRDRSHAIARAPGRVGRLSPPRGRGGVPRGAALRRRVRARPRRRPSRHELDHVRMGDQARRRALHSRATHGCSRRLRRPAGTAAGECAPRRSQVPLLDRSALCGDRYRRRERGSGAPARRSSTQRRSRQGEVWRWSSWRFKGMGRATDTVSTTRATPSPAAGPS